MRSQGPTLIRYEWCPYQKMRVRIHGETPGKRPLANKVRRWPSSSQGERPQEKPTDSLFLDLQPPELWGNKFLLFKLHNLWLFCYGGLSRLIHSPLLFFFFFFLENVIMSHSVVDGDPGDGGEEPWLPDSWFLSAVPHCSSTFWFADH